MGMIFRAFRWMFVYACVGTVLALAIGAGYLWSGGLLNPDKMFKILAVVHDVSLEPDTNAQSSETPSMGPQPSYEEIATAREVADRQLEIKMLALGKRVDDLRYRQAQLDKDRERQQTLAREFSVQLEQLLGETKTEGYATVRNTLESLKAPQAKDHLMAMVKANDINDVVALIKDMQTDKRAKILREFTTDEEREVIDDVLSRIRQGMPRADLIQNTMDVMQTSQ